MLIYIDEAQREIEDIQKYACLIRDKFETQCEVEELLSDARNLKERIEMLEAMLPEKSIIAGALQHSGWMIYWLKKGDLTSCKHDITDICNVDLPRASTELREWTYKLAWVDADLRRVVFPFVRSGQFSMAIREAFVTLKARICGKFDLDTSIDNEDLLNRLFGERSTRLPLLSPREKAAYHNLFSGLFSLLRSHFVHDDGQLDISDLDALLTNVNMCLRIIGDFHGVPAEQINAYAAEG